MGYLGEHMCTDVCVNGMDVQQGEGLAAFQGRP